MSEPIPATGKAVSSTPTGVHDAAGAQVPIPEGAADLGNVAKNISQIAGAAGGAVGLLSMIDKAFEAMTQAADGKDQVASILAATMGMQGVAESAAQSGPATTVIGAGGPAKGGQER